MNLSGRFLPLACLVFMGCQKPPLPTPSGPPTSTQAEAEKTVDRLVAMGWMKFVFDDETADVRWQLVGGLTRRRIEAEWDSDGVSYDRRG